EHLARAVGLLTGEHVDELVEPGEGRCALLARVAVRRARVAAALLEFLAATAGAQLVGSGLGHDRGYRRLRTARDTTQARAVVDVTAPRRRGSWRAWRRRCCRP